MNDSVTEHNASGPAQDDKVDRFFRMGSKKIYDVKKMTTYNGWTIMEPASYRKFEKVSEFLALLDLTVPSDTTEQIVIPAYFAINTRKVWGIGITTRSTLDLLEILRATVEVPQEHVSQGLDIKYPPVGLPGRGVRIISSKERPKNDSTAVKYEGYWFYTDKTDQRTKAVFRLVRTFWSISITGDADQKSAPVLTIPVSQ